MLVATASFANDTISVVTYNLLFYDEIPQSRDTNFRKTILYIQPDVLVVQEIGSQANVDNFLTNVLNYYTPGLYTSAQFYNTSNLNVAMFYKPALFDLLNVVAIPTYPRDIMKYRLLHLKSGQVFDVFGLHLKAGNSSANMNDRNNEALQLRAYTNQYPVNFNYIVCGDFNFYGDFEPAYQTLLLNNGSDIGNFKDHLNLSGTWNNYEYRFHHSQSTRTRSFGGGATGGCDDRFDFFLFSPAVVNEGGMTYVQGSSVPIGNDGNHYNDSINERPVTAVPDSIADALHYASDHLPVISKYVMVSSVSISNSGTSFISDFKLTSVYPNPFNYRVNFSLNVSVVDEYYISIYDVNGREVAQIGKQYLTPGNYKYYFDGNELSSGNYFLRVRNSSEQIIRRIVLVK
ncbi:T9SS type A sorting domain-containing protein [Ignavibacteria bacterium CHB1]|nr:MAG: T9SS C-terminal target domain-containing protein [Chlorobiota bacterium]MBV6398365.1 hypothetical protein [Ignavibacteria bacterium]MCC6886044.1 T9SS type A sorting domain-containing protein [Ignavibacteriales bacterium]MCE7952705.1 T9SS C-terminal target domain-containing protein [Chlorobi bacterium CHB7]MDL1886816.1 T9SS type A sorting domain-containing protein [Ignavibacteria bacterium CHB1]RIK50342.1 MAG: hypothetical protein DCC60_00640 [Ignavibacteriota bacterium]